MTDQDFSGKWTGEYVYGDVYANHIKGTKVPFEITMMLNDGIVKGDCVDDESKQHFTSPATIEGFIKDNTIQFIKKYPCFFSVDNNGEVKLYPKLPSHEIHYSGRFVNGQFTGDWHFTVPYPDGQGGVFEYTGRGNWQMQKV